MYGSSERAANQDGRREQYLEMMEALTALESKYGGVRGELLKKVRAELEKLKPASQGLSVVGGRDSAPASTGGRCQACGRELKLNGTNGMLMCQNGHRG